VAAEYGPAAEKFAATYARGNDGRAAAHLVDWLLKRGR
jgi:hypothetical protein